MKKIFKHKNGGVYYIVKNGRSKFKNKKSNIYVAYPASINPNSPEIAIGPILDLSSFTFIRNEDITNEEKGFCYPAASLYDIHIKNGGCSSDFFRTNFKDL